jgi:hypothetical protein
VVIRNSCKPPPKSAARRYYHSIIRGITSDLGGDLPTALRELVVNFGSTATLLREQNLKIVAGESAEIVIADFAVLINALVKLGSRVGLKRIPKEVVSLEMYLADLNQRDGKYVVEEIDGANTQAEDFTDASVQDNADGE